MAFGTPEEVASCEDSITGRYLQALLQHRIPLDDGR
jgi:hypothetical protein